MSAAGTTGTCLHVCHVIAIGGKADLGLAALTRSIYENSLASCAFTAARH